MKVVITGGAGFLGLRLARQLLARGTLTGRSGRPEPIARILLLDEPPLRRRIADREDACRGVGARHPQGQGAPAATQLHVRPTRAAMMPHTPIAFCACPEGIPNPVSEAMPCTLVLTQYGRGPANSSLKILFT